MTAGPRGHSTTLALGGTRSIPAPDPVARDYLLLALRLDQHIPGLVDGYFGPADLKAQVDIEQTRSPARLRDDAAALRGRLADEVDDVGRRGWLDAQLLALETQAASLAGEQLPYMEHVTRCFDWTPVRRDDAVFEAAAAELDALLPGEGDRDLVERLAEWDEQFTVPADRLPVAAEWLVERFRERARRLFGLPEGEELRVGFVRNQPWSGYNWYDGGLRSRVDLNLDLPSRTDALVDTVAHETYPGHHLEHAWKEADLVDRQARLEASVLLINTPESLISEGLAELGVSFAIPPEDLPDLLVELYGLAGLPIAKDPAAARDAAERQATMKRPRAILGEAQVNAALLRHADGADHDEVLRYLIEIGRVPEPRARKRLEFIEHPLWRTYVFVYDEGEALLRRWLDAVPEGQRPTRFGRLLHEALTPSAIAADLAERSVSV